MVYLVRNFLIVCFLILALKPTSFADAVESKPTISGISSGAFMAVQMATIYSSQFSGLGTVAGGFFYCAKNHLQEKIWEGDLTFLGSKNLFLYSNMSQLPNG